MLSLDNLWKTTGQKKPKRYGLGKSGGSKTCGRGQKGQKSRSGSHLPYSGFEGGQTPLQRRLPKRGFKNPTRIEFQVVNLATLDSFEDGSEITPELLLEKRIVRRNDMPVKILGYGDLSKKLTVKAHRFSQSALAAIASSGGTAEVVE